MSTSRGRRAILESKVEDYLVEQVEAHGGRADKFCTPGRRGPPDRLITWPRVGFCKMELVEVKTIDEYGHPTALDPLQVIDHRDRAALGCIVRVIWTKYQVDEYIRYEMSRRGGKESALYQGYDLVKTKPRPLQPAEYTWRQVKPRKFKKRAPANIAAAGEEFAPYVEGRPCDPGFGGR